MNFNHTKIFHGVLFLMALLLTACGGGSSSTTPPPSTSPQGFWNGATTSGNAVVGVVLSDGSYYVVYTQANNPATIAGVIQGTGTSNAGVFSSSNARDFNFEGLGTNDATLLVSYTEKQAFGGTLSYAAGGTETFATTYDASYEATPSLSALAGTFGGQAGIFSYGAQNFLIDVSSAGNLTGTDGTCSVSGTVSPRTDGNTYNVSILMGPSPCVNANQTFTGIGAYDSLTTEFDVVALNAARTDGVIFIGLKGATVQATLSSIAVTPANPSIAPGSSQQLVATGTNSDSTTGIISASATWSTSNSAVATVSATGLVSGVAAGTAVITATQSGISGTTTVTVAAAGGIATAPANVVATCGDRKITISWSAVTGATSYNVYRSTTSGVAGTLLGSSNTSSYVDTTGTLGTTYYYTVKTVNSSGESAASAEVFDAFYKLMGGALQGASLALGGNVVTFAGSSGFSGLRDGVGTAAKFSSPYGVATDGTNVFVADYVNNVIRKVDPTTQAVSVFAGSSTGLSGSTDGVGTAATFFRPYDITSDGTNLYVTDNSNCTIRKIVIATATVSTFAGTGICVSPSVDGTGTGASFDSPQGITTDGTSLFVTENTVVRKIDIATKVVSKFAGSTAVVVGHVDAVGTLARFNNLEGITTDGTSLFVADRYYQDIRKIDIATANVSSLAGNYTNVTTSTSTDGTGTGATFNLPMGITTDGTNLYVTESSGGVTGGGYVIRKIANGTTATTSAAVVTTLAGSPGVGGTTDGVGSAALFRSLWGITIYCGNLIIVDSGNSSIRVLY